MATQITAAPTPITVAYGDGIGPEIMAATLDVAMTVFLHNYDGAAGFTLAQDQ
jgi:isocitrate/isopropylmalate dehydrogenase